MSSDSGSGDPGSNLGKGDNFFNLSLFFGVGIGIFFSVQIWDVTCVYMGDYYLKVLYFYTMETLSFY